VFDDEDCRPSPRQLGEERSDFGRTRRIELRRGLIEHQEARSHDDDACDRHPLLLPSGERKGLTIGEIDDPEASQHVADSLIHDRSIHAKVLETKGEFLANRLLRCGQLVGRRRKHNPDVTQ
jgi:hypothetical protein